MVHPLFINIDTIHFAKYPDSGEYHENWLLERGSASQARLKLGVDSASALAIYRCRLRVHLDHTLLVDSASVDPV